MFWFRRPPYLRWVAAGALVAVAFVMDVSDTATTPHPFAAELIRRGELIDASKIEWKPVPVGLLAAPDLAGAIAGIDVQPGEPLLEGGLRRDDAVPSGWWAVPLALPADAVPGTAVRLVVLSPLDSVDGLIVRSGEMGTFGVPEAGLVAVPGERAAEVAAAAARAELTVLLEP